MGVEEVAKMLAQRLVQAIWRRHEVGPVEEATRQRHAVRTHRIELFANDLRVVISPHQGPAGAGPKIYTHPNLRLAVEQNLVVGATHAGLVLWSL
jgi:hypothetical protein